MTTGDQNQSGRQWWALHTVGGQDWLRQAYIDQEQSWQALEPTIELDMEPGVRIEGI